MAAKTSRTINRPAKPRASNRSVAANKTASTALGTLSERQASVGRAVLIHAISGAGKTVLAIHKAPRPILVLDCDNGLDSIEGTEDSDNIHVWSPSFGSEFVWEDLDMFRNYVKSGDWSLPYKTIVVDNVTAAQAPVISWSINELIVKAQSSQDGGPSKIDPDVPSQQGWGKIYRVMDKWIREIRDAKRTGVNVIFTSGTAEWMDKSEGFVKLMPDLEGKVRTRITTHMDAVGYLESDDDGRRLYLGPNGSFITKVRLPIKAHGKLPEAVENPDFNSMMDAVKIVERKAKKKSRPLVSQTTKKKATKPPVRRKK